MNSTYETYLSSKAWSEKRQQKLALCRFQCEACGTKTSLQVHHLTYQRIFKEEMNDLMVLCTLHHEAAEEMISKGAIKRTGNVKTLRRETLRFVGDQSFCSNELSSPKTKRPAYPFGIRKNYQKTKRECAGLIREWIRILPRPEFKQRVTDLFSHVKKSKRRSGILMRALRAYDSAHKRP